MNPEERVLLERTLKLSEENNEILRKMQRAAKLAFIWGFIKVALLLAPLVLGYLFLQPYLDQAFEGFSGARELFESL